MTKHRDYTIDVLKITATIIIIFHHYQEITGAFFEGKLNFYFGKFSFDCMVELFFVISGYCMVSYVDKIKKGLTFKEFYLRRAKRLLPLVACAAVVSEIIHTVYYIKDWKCFFSVKPDLFGILLDALGIQAGWAFANPQVNNPTWYVSVLLLCYAIFYLLTYFSGKWKVSAKYFYVAMILIGCGVRTYGINLPFLNIYSYRGFYSFFFGILLGMYLKDRVPTEKEILLALVSCGFIIFCGINYYSRIKNDIYYIVTFFFYPSLIVMMHSNFVQAIFTSSVWGKMAKISYDVFVWHFPVLMAVEPLLTYYSNYDKNNIGYMFLYGVVAIVVGIISRLLIEIPIEKKLERAG